MRREDFEAGQVYTATVPFADGSLGRRIVLSAVRGSITYEDQNGDIHAGVWWTTMRSWVTRWKATVSPGEPIGLEAKLGLKLFRNRKNGKVYAALGLADDRTADVPANRVIYLDDHGGLHHRTIADFQRAFEAIDDPAMLVTMTRVAMRPFMAATQRST